MVKNVTLLCLIFYVNSASCLCRNLNGSCYELFSNENNTKVAQYNILPQTKTCIEPGYKKICSAHGNCINNSCICEVVESLDENHKTDNSYRYSGKYCEECPYCKGQRCDKIALCIECFKNNFNCNESCFMFYLQSDYVTKLNTDEKWCEIEDRNGCYFRFKYFYEGEHLLVNYGKYVQCINSKNFLRIIFWGVILYIIFLMVLITKLFNGYYLI